MNKQSQTVYQKDNRTAPIMDTATERLPKERWKDIPDFEGLYQLSDYGRVRSLSRWVYSENRPDAFRPGRVIKLRVTSTNKKKEKNAADVDIQMKLHKDKVRYYFSVSRFVYFLFVSPFDLKDYSVIIRRKDGDKLNCRYNNLIPETISDIAKEGYASGKRKSLFQQQVKPVSQYSLDGKLIRTFDTTKEAAAATGIHPGQISDGAVRKVRQVKGYYFRYGRPLEQINVSKLKRRLEHAMRVRIKKVQKLSLEGKPLKIYDSVSAAAKSVGLPSGTNISYACMGKLHTSKGYRWRYV